MPEAERIVIDGLRETEDELSLSRTAEVRGVSFGVEIVSPLVSSSFSSSPRLITSPTSFPRSLALLDNFIFSFASG
jgi:hypothetical protein